MERDRLNYAQLPRRLLHDERNVKGAFVPGFPDLLPGRRTGRYTDLAMKTKVTVSIDEELIPRARQSARRKGISLSELVEASLRSVTEERETASFSQRWRGKFQPAGGDDERSKALAKRYL